MDLQEEREFNETMSLVKAVLERLEFHAFEDVLIWSNEHASKALLRCLKKTLSEFENGHLVLTNSYPKLKHFSVDSVVKGLLTTLDQAQERQDSLNKEIDELSDQLAKAKAVPEGFVLVRASDRDREVCELIGQRDNMERLADQLKDKLQDLYKVDFGEYTSCNCPLKNAIKYDDSNLVLVPREPTEEMLGAAWEAPPAGGPSGNRCVFYEKQAVVYKAMVEEAEKAMIKAQEQK